MNRIFITAVAAIALFVAACNDKKETVNKPEDILAKNVDSSANPADDFFAWANGQWIKNNPIPDDETSWGIAHMVQEELYNRLRTINEQALKAENKSTTEKQIANFWYSGMDTASIESMGINPLKPELHRIYEAKNTQQLMDQVAAMHVYGVGVFFSEGPSQDAMKSDEMAFYMMQGGLGMPNRDYYFNTDERTANIRNQYPAYVTQILQFAGYEPEEAAVRAEKVIALETRLAKSSRKLEDLRDPYANYNKMSIEGLDNMSENIDWHRVFAIMKVRNIDSIIIGQPEFFTTLDELIATERLDILKDYMAFHLIRTFGAYLSTPFVNANFDFYSKTIRGAKELRPRWKRVLDAEEDAMGEVLGQLFVKEYFDETAKERYEQIVENVRDAYKDRIENLDWMSDSTKKKALNKLTAIKKKVGYPDKWKDFSGLVIDRGPFVLNIMRANKWWHEYYMNKLGKPVDRDEWEMTPQTYNAYYNPSNNEIVLPAGIFTVPGYRDEQLDDALVYGYAASSTIGHEITHGFDDEGRQFDAQGNLSNWWTSRDEEQFTQRANVMVQQFNNIIVVDSMRINGAATLGENLADLGGVLIGLDAFKKTEAYKNGEKINGYTPLQRFFMGYALGWLYQIRKEQLASQVMTDVHSPAKYRVNGVFPNVPEFYEAFNVKPGDKMYIPDSLRVKLW